MGKLIEIYHDDLIVFSEDQSSRISHMIREYGISLNAEKLVLGVDEGKLIEFVISKYGVKVDPKITKEIKQIPLPTNKKAL